MSNSIWKTPDQKPEPGKQILEHWKNCYGEDRYAVWIADGERGFDKYTVRWCYCINVDDLIAATDRAERLQKAVDNIKETNDAMMRVLGKQVAEESTDDEEYCWYSCCRIKDYLQALDCTETVKPKSGIPHNALCYFQDGDMVCCVFGDFVNLQESPAGFGKTNEEAFEDLKRNWDEIKQLIKE